MDNSAANTNTSSEQESKSTGFESLAVQIYLTESEIACNGIKELNTDSNATDLFCPRVFDGWSCWNKTAAGQTALNPCPPIFNFDTNLKAHKICLEDGTWFRHPESNRTWSNYTTCVNFDILTRHLAVIATYQIGYIISLVALILSLLIFWSLRKPISKRVKIHVNLFLSFVLNNILWLIWYNVLTNETISISDVNQIICIGHHIVVYYFTLCNMFWMLCEGLHMHTILIGDVFSRAKTSVPKRYVVFGWGGASIPISFYVLCRFLNDNPFAQKDCWIHESGCTLILSGTVGCTLILSLWILIKIIKVIYQQEQNRRNLSTRQENGERSFKENILSLFKAVVASLILIPLFGLQFWLVAWRTADEHSDLAVFQYFFAAILTSLQGLVVSLLFCFGDPEVRETFRRRYKLVRERLQPSRRTGSRVTSVGLGGQRNRQQLTQQTNSV